MLVMEFMKVRIEELPEQLRRRIEVAMTWQDCERVDRPPQWSAL